MVEAIKHTYILEEYQGDGGPDQGVLDMKGVKVMLIIVLRFFKFQRHPRPSVKHVLGVLD